LDFKKTTRTTTSYAFTLSN